MLACTAIFCLQQIVGLEPWLALFPLASGNFMPWQLVTYAFLHFDLLHLFFNMLGLWMFGAELERLWGQKRMAQFLVISVVAAALSQLAVTWLLGSRAITVGASGALYGLLLAYAMSFPRRQFDLLGFVPMVLLMTPYQVLHVVGMVLFVVMVTNRQALPIPPVLAPAMVTVAIFGFVELLMGMFLRSNIAHFAHLGGMVGGFLIIRFWRGQPPFGRRR
jgi:membrane associated rhomboid family serine protease